MEEENSSSAGKPDIGVDIGIGMDIDFNAVETATAVNSSRTPATERVAKFGLSPTKPLHLHTKSEKSVVKESNSFMSHRTGESITESFETAMDGSDLADGVNQMSLYNDDPTPRVLQEGMFVPSKPVAGVDEDETPIIEAAESFVDEHDNDVQHDNDIQHDNDASNEFEHDTTLHSIQSTDQSHVDSVNSYKSELASSVYDKSYEKADPVGVTQELLNSSELLSLFLYALHDFDASTLDQSSESTVCLSFNKGDVAFVHSVDKSGWSEVTLLKNLWRGWIPVNFFTELVKDDETLALSKSRIPLKLLLISTAKFLNNPIDNPLNGNSYFSLDQVNAIRDGVRYLLELTNCLSRSTTIVKKRPIIRKMRKTLLADWYSLMIKADSYKHTHSLKHVETLQLMALQVVKKSITFLDIWSIESESLRKEQVVTRRKTDMPLLRTPPFGKGRLNEIHNVLFGYIGLLLGRLDMVEHNPAGCQLLENITHQMILLLKELLYINKSCVNILDSQSRRLEKFDDNLDVLLSLVSELVSSVKNFVTKMINEPSTEKPLKQGPYQYSSEGLELMGVISRMTRSISLSVDTCYKYLAIIGDFRLSEDKEYTDFSKVQITPDQFIKTCSLGMIKTMDKTKLEMVRTAERNSIKRQSKFSMVRSGNDNFTVSGSNLLQEFLPDSKSFIRSSVFQPYLNETSERYEIPFDRDSEILYDSEGSLSGASFRGLVYLLTDELRKTEPFFISTFFLTFKSYSTSDALIEELISRFNFEDSTEDESTGEYSSYDSRLKNRRRLIAKIFQLWIQSYWDYTGDYNLIPTLINFFNEEVSQYLSIESKKLIELCSKLIIVTPSVLETTKTVTKTKFGGVDSAVIQLVSRRLSSTRSAMSNSSSVNSFVSLNKELDDEEHIFEEYELTKVKSCSRNSTLLPLPGLNFNQNSLLNKSQINEIEHEVVKHRIALSSINWPVESVARYVPMETQHLLKVWYECCQSRLQCEFRPDSHLTELNGFELAKQLTIIESRIFLSVKPEELLNQNFLKRHHLSPNIQQSLLFTNLLSAYVLESILEEELTMKKRTTRIKQWLNIALSCYYLKNFNSLAAIVISLQSHILSRLDEVWATLPEKYHALFSDLKKIIHPTNNYKGYRYKLSKILKDGDTKSPIPVVPYINLFLQDLTFINEGNRDYRNSESFLKERIINFDKFRRVAKIIANMEYLQVGYDDAPKKRRSSVFSFASSISLDDNLTVIPPLQEYILLELLRVQQLNLRDDERAWNLSKKLKP